MSLALIPINKGIAKPSRLPTQCKQYDKAANSMLAVQQGCKLYACSTTTDDRLMMTDLIKDPAVFVAAVLLKSRVCSAAEEVASAPG